MPPSNTRPATPPANTDAPERVPELRDAAEPGYVREWEWELFCDYTAATAQPALPTSLAALTGFFTALPARPNTVARRVRAIAAAHRRAGYLLERPDTGPGAPPPAGLRRDPDPGPLIAACPTRGWPDGPWGRRDAFLIVLTEHLGLTHPGARELHPDDLTLPGDDQAPLSVAGSAVVHGDDPRSCPACAVLRWLDVLGVADGLGRGSARMALIAARAPTAASPTRVHPPRRHGGGERDDAGWTCRHPGRRVSAASSSRSWRRFHTVVAHAVRFVDHRAAAVDVADLTLRSRTVVPRGSR